MPVRSAAPIKKHAVPLRPLLIALSVLTAVWAAPRFSTAAFKNALSRGLEGEAALFLLRAETAADMPRPPSYGALLSFASPLLVPAASPDQGESPPGEGFLPLQDGPPPPPPVMTPTPPAASESPPPETEQPPSPAPSHDGIWDDRVWPVPNGSDPGARPLREVTLLPVDAGGGYLTDGTVDVNNE